MIVLNGVFINTTKDGGKASKLQKWGICLAGFYILLLGVSFAVSYRILVKASGQTELQMKVN